MTFAYSIYFSILSAIIFIFLQASGICFGDMATRQLIVATASLELGRGEEKCDNCGDYVSRYTRGKQVSWCAGFVSYVLDHSGVREFGYQLSAREYYNIAKKKKRLTNDPQIGDLIVFWRESKDSWKGHVGIIIYTGNTEIWTIEGNVGDYPAVVKKIKYQRDNIPNLLGFVKTVKD